MELVNEASAAAPTLITGGEVCGLPGHVAGNRILKSGSILGQRDSSNIQTIIWFENVPQKCEL